MKKPSPYLLLVIATILWGGNFVIGRAVADQLPPFTLSFLRWCTALIVFYPFVRKRLKGDWPAIKKHWKIVVLMAFTGISGFNTLVYIALHYTSSINASLVNSMTPILIFLLSFLFFREHLHRNQLLGTIISLFGVLFILSEGSLAKFVGLSFNIGDLIVVVAVMCWGVYSVLVKQYAARLPGYSTFFCSMILGLILLLPLCLIEVNSASAVLKWNVASVASVGYIGIFASIVAFVSWNTAVAELGANKAGIFLNFIPVFASIFAIAFIGENLAWFQLAGGLFVIVGVYLSTKLPAKRTEVLVEEKIQS